jgi:molybdopterin synthase sulfur carrier subunit
MLMQIELELFGALRGLMAQDRLQLAVEGAAVAEARAALQRYAAIHWPPSAQALLRSCAFATSSEVLRDPHPLPADGKLAVLPPVSGG